MMKTVRNKREFKNILTWEEESGLLAFLSEVPREVDAFNRKFEFGIQYLSNPSATIDGSLEPARKIGFVLTRHNVLLPEVTYCLYAVLENKMLHAYIGLIKEDNIVTLRKLKPAADYKQGKIIMYDWLSQLVRSSCEKIMI